MHGNVQYTTETHALSFALILEALICRHMHIFQSSYLDKQGCMQTRNNDSYMLPILNETNQVQVLQIKHFRHSLNALKVAY